MRDEAFESGQETEQDGEPPESAFSQSGRRSFSHESIKTTNPKASELRRVADRLITLAKSGSAHAARLAFAFLRDKQAVKKLFSDIGGRYGGVNGGYTRVLKLGPRKGDAAPMALIELTQKREQPEEDKGQKKADKAKAAKEKKTAKAKAAKETKTESAGAKKPRRAQKQA